MATETILPNGVIAVNQVQRDSGGNIINGGGGGGGGGDASASNQTSGAQKTQITNSSGTALITEAVATAAKQDTANSSLSSIASNTASNATAANQTTLNTLTGAVTETAPASDTASSGLNGRLQRVAQNLTALYTAMTTGLGLFKLWDGTNTANIFLGDTGQNSLAVSGARKEVTFSTTTAQAVATTDAGNYVWVSVQVTSQGTSSTITFQTSNNNSNWDNVSLVQSSSTTSATAQSISVAIANVTFHGPLPGRYFRLNVTGISAGTTAGTIQFFSSPRQLAGQGVSATQNGIWSVAVPAATTGGYSTSRINTNGTAIIKSGAGTLHSITIGTKGVTNTLMVYDNTTGSGTALTPTIDTTLSAQTFTFDAAFSTGLTAVMSGGTAADVVFNYK